MLMLVLKRSKPRPKKVYRDEQAIFMAILAAREAEKTEKKLSDSKLKFAERRSRSGQEGMYKGKTPYQIWRSKQKKWLLRQKSRRIKFSSSQKRTFLSLVKSDKIQLLKKPTILLDKLSEQRQQQLENGIHISKSILGDGRRRWVNQSFYSRGVKKTIPTAKTRESQILWPGGDRGYTQNVRERFWTFASKKTRTLSRNLLGKGKRFVNELMLGRQEYWQYLSDYPNGIERLYKYPFYLIALREFTSSFSKYVQFGFNLQNNLMNYNFTFNHGKFIFQHRMILSRIDIISFAKKMYIFLNITRFLMSLNLTNLTEKTQDNHIMNQLSVVYKPKIYFFWSESLNVKKERLLDPFGIPFILPYFFTYSLQKYGILNRFLSRFQKLQLTNVSRNSIVTKFGLGKFVQYNEHRLYPLVSRSRLILEENHLFSSLYESYFNVISRRSLYKSSWILYTDLNLIEPIVYDALELTAHSQSPLFRDLYKIMSRLDLEIIKPFYSSRESYRNLLDFYKTETVTHFKDLNDQVFFNMQILKNILSKVLEHSLYNRDLAYPLLFPILRKGYSSIREDKESAQYHGTQLKLSGDYTTSVRERYKKENPILIRLLVRAMARGGGKLKALSTIGRFCKLVRQKHDFYNLSSRFMLAKAFKFCYPRVRLKRFIRGSSKIYKFMPLRRSRRISTGIYRLLEACYVRAAFRKTHRKFQEYLAEEVGSILQGLLTNKWLAQDRYGLTYSNGQPLDVTDQLTPPTLELMRNERQLYSNIRAYPSRVRGRRVLNSPYAQYMKTKKVKWKNV